MSRLFSLIFLANSDISVLYNKITSERKMIFMNMQKLTKKTIEAIQAAQDTALNYGNTNVDQPHLLYALLVQESGLIPQLVKKLG
ncbi:MAG: Clp protease N-terminal domain-containing protein, partial [Huintestinicola sp.]